MSLLFDALPDGAFHLQNFIGEETQKEMVSECRILCRDFPLMQPQTAKGFPLALKVSSWGKAGWFGNHGKYEYLRTHENGKPFPKIPNLIESLMRQAVTTCGFEPFELDTVLMNYYPSATGKLGRHQDVTEDDKESPIITISLGDSCIFNIGSTDYNDKGFNIELKSGDCFVMGGPSRLAYHEVKSLIPNSSKLLSQGGRISLTGRRVFDSTSLRNEFQRKHSAEYIHSLEMKFLDKNLRTREEHCAKALTPEERLIYAEYLDIKGEPLGAQSFREYVEPIEKKK